MDPLPDLAARLAYLREQAGLSQREASDLADLASSHVQAIEQRTRRSPSVDTVARLARLFGVTLDWLVFGCGEPPTAEATRAAVLQARAALPSLEAGAAP